MSADSERSRVFFSTIPMQHGAYSIFIACFILGTWVGGRLAVESAVLLGSILFALFARHSFSVYFRKARGRRRVAVLFWAMIYSAVFLGLGAILVLSFDLWLLLVLALLALAFGAGTTALGEFTTSGEIAGILGLTLIASAAEYVGTGDFTTRTVNLWILCAFFFIGSVFHVRYLVRRREETGGPLSIRLRAGFPSIAYHLLALDATIYLASVQDMLPTLAPVALIPITLKAIWTVGHRYEKPLPIRQIGYREVAHTLTFVVITGIAYYLG